VRPQVLPWHDAVWHQLTGDLSRLPHAILLQGAAGVGKFELARRLAESLLCAAPGEAAAACGQCRGCALLAAGTHPDLLMVQPQDESKFVIVDQVRALGGFLALKPHTAQRKVVILQPADAMNVNAANSLLKALEEPPLGSILLLVSDRPARLPATIRSRCARISVRRPDSAQALVWLAGQGIDAQDAQALLNLATGAPLRAWQLGAEGFHRHVPALAQEVRGLLGAGADPVACAARWKELGAERCLAWLYGYVAGEIRVRMGCGADGLQVGTKALDLRRLHDFLDVVSEAHRQLASSLDEALLLEDILIRWSRVAR
jgi:DNA polymerase-3 subunit delta'